MTLAAVKDKRPPTAVTQVRAAARASVSMEIPSTRASVMLWTSDTE